MAHLPPPSEKLSFGEKLSRLSVRMKDPEWRRYGALLATGKLMGLALTVAMVILIPMLLSGSRAHADSVPAPAPAAVQMDSAAVGAPAPAPAPVATPAPTVAASDIVNPLNTVWTLIAAFLVFAMQAGFVMLEAGFCRSRETVNVLVECVFDTCLCGILFWAFGYAFMFSEGNGFIGTHWFFLKNTPATFGATGIPILAHWLFQFAFADCASTITSGAMVGRTGFWGDILYSIAVSGFIYPIAGHWAWGPDGFLATMGSAGKFLPSLGMNFHDFAGSTVVHTIGGAVALVGAIVLGPRIGRKFKRDGGGPMMPHDLTIAVVGGLFLWFGWYGFNPGSTLSAMDFQGIGRVAANTTLAACAAGMTSVSFVYYRTGKWDAGSITNGFLAGLVAITCPCYWVSPFGSIIIGGIAGFVVILGTDLLEYLRIDDPIGAVPVHLMNGIWGTLSLGLFASGEFSAIGSDPLSPNTTTLLTGLFYGGGFKVLIAQFIGSFIIFSATVIVSYAVMKAVDAIGLLRISKEGELDGMDLHEHGISAYPEYVISALSAPAGLPVELSKK
ncbi:ammonium transporter [Holophaga foetida]|uniref:ammonium transporter n=1 Tax=Holophaga foetida TaxID=35839 RepID=UPI0002472167|nr:ammonium transporter [Holophaga foetida]